MRTFILYCLILFSLLSCNKNDDSTSNNVPQELASISIFPITDIAGDFAISGGEVINDGGSNIIQKGVCWSKFPNPTVSDNTSNNGSGASFFISQITELEFNTTYYVRAFAINNTGIAYSEELSLLSTNKCTLNVFDGDVILNTQSDVDVFGANNYCRITGRLHISENTANDPIVDLTPLNNIRAVHSVTVMVTNTLENLSGLENLTEVEFEIGIFGNDQLINLNGLNNVNSELVNIIIANNDQIQNIDGLSGITTITRTLEGNSKITILGNPNLLNINGLSNISVIDESLFISIGSSNFITNLDGLSNISGTINHLGITGLDSLLNINGLLNITSIDGNVFISNHHSLVDLSGLANLRFVGGDLVLLNNNSFSNTFKNLDGLSNLETVGGDLSITNNSLTDFCGLETLINGNGLGGNYLVYDNTYNPTQQDIIDGNCSQ